MGKVVSAIKLLFFLSHNSTQKHLVSRSSRRIRSDDQHLDAAISWLKTAQDNSKGDGIAAGWSPIKGWLPSCSETTGNTIETFVEYARRFADMDALHRAIRMGDWEIKIQLPSGAVRGGIDTNAYPIVFNTGQVMHGWVALYKETGEARFLEAAVRAAEWLQSIQDEDGCWRRYTYQDTPHAYNSQVAWAMLTTAEQALRLDLRATAKKNIEWVMSCVRDDGWIDGMESLPDQPPSTHTIAYTLRGLLESAPFLPNLEPLIIEQVYKASQLIIVNNLAEELNSSKLSFMPGTLQQNWQSNDKYICLAGNSQLAILFLKLTQYVEDDRLVLAANQLINQVKATHCLKYCSRHVKGAIAGSFPFWGGYLKFQFPSQAVKFFADAIMLKMKESK
ncbi:hypothetical protein K8I28_03505 [bacterium]|nr:hypothetical protein [bacterium]